MVVFAYNLHRIKFMKNKFKMYVFIALILLSIKSQAAWLDDLMMPELSSSQKEWHTFTRSSIREKDPIFPLQVLNDGYKMIETYAHPQLKGVTFVRWGWQITVRNRSNYPVSVSVHYFLKDVDNFTVASGMTLQNWLIRPGNTVTIQDTDSIQYKELKRVTESSWSLDFHYKN